MVERHSGRGGRREGAGRPPTYRRITLDQEAARQLAALVDILNAEYPEARWTGSALVGNLVNAAYRREAQRRHQPQDQQRQQPEA